MYSLEGYDTFDGHYYPIEGSYKGVDEAIAAAFLRNIELRKTQPHADLRDKTYVVSPDGTRKLAC